MCASILISVPDLQSLVDNNVCKFEPSWVIFKTSIALNLITIQDGQVQLELPKRKVSEVIAILVDEGICFSYIS